MKESNMKGLNIYVINVNTRQHDQIIWSAIKKQDMKNLKRMLNIHVTNMNTKQHDRLVRSIIKNHSMKNTSQHNSVI